MICQVPVLRTYDPVPSRVSHKPVRAIDSQTRINDLDQSAHKRRIPTFGTH